MSLQGDLEFRDANKITFIGGSSNTVIDTTTGSLGVGVGVGGPTSNLHVVGNALITGNVSDLNIVSNVNMLHTTNTASIKLNSNVVTEFPRSRKLIKYPRVAMTSASQDGYVVTTSSTRPDSAGYSYDGYNVFDNTRRVGFTGSWTNETNSNYNLSGNVYNPAADTPTRNLGTGAVDGEWLKLELPNKIRLEHVKLAFDQTNDPTRAPKDFLIYGSNDNVNWTELLSVTDANYVGGSSTVAGDTSHDVKTTTFYKYFGVVVTKISGQPNYFRIHELEYYGIPEYDPEAHGTDVVVKSLPNVPNTDWLEVYYDAKDLTTMPSIVTDLAGGDQNGTPGTGVTFDSTYKAFVFDASGSGTVTTSKITSSTLPSTFVDDTRHSVATWFKLDTTMGAQTLFTIKDNTSGVVNQTPHAVIQDGILRYDFWTNNIQLLDQIVANEWYHLVITFSGGNHQSGTKFYINGVHNTNVSTPSSTANLDIQVNSVVYVGGSISSYDKGIDGSIANFRLFNRAITQDEVWQLYAYQKEYFGHGDLSMTLKAGRLGIGTSEPKVALDVRGTANFSTINIDGVIKSNAKLLVGAYSGDGSSDYPALSGWHLAQLNNMYNLGLTNGFYYIQSPMMPNPLQMYVNFTADGGGYDFYRYTSATSTNFVFQDNGARSALGLDIFYPRSQSHWAAIYDFVVNVNGSTVTNDIKVAGAVHSSSITLPTVQTTSATESYTDNYANLPIRDPRYYGSGVPDWKVPDGGKWWLRDSFTEPNGDYVYNAYLSLYALSISGIPSFNDANANASTSTGTTIICSTNVKGSSPMYM